MCINLVLFPPVIFMVNNWDYQASHQQESEIGGSILAAAKSRQPQHCLVAFGARLRVAVSFKRKVDRLTRGLAWGVMSVVSENDAHASLW